jgi:hypothetical protein
VTASDHDTLFLQRFGMSKQQKIDTWIVMDETELEEECAKFNIPFQKGDFLLGLLMKQTEAPVESA